MNELDPETPRDPEWEKQFNVVHGHGLIATRQFVYNLLPRGEVAPDYAGEIHEAAVYAGVSEHASIVDAGCSFPRDLLLWKLARHLGALVGYDKNPKQFQAFSIFHPAKIPASSAPFKLREEFIQKSDFEIWKGRDEYAGISLIEASAAYTPIADRSVDLITASFVWQQLDKSEQSPAIIEAKRMLKNAENYPDSDGQQSGIFAMSTSDSDNKQLMHENETKIATVLSQILGRTIYPPVPLQEGFTTEKALEVMAENFNFVYVKKFKQDIVADSEGAKQILLNAYRTLGKHYVDDGGNEISTDELEFALRVVPSAQIDDALRKGNAVIDKMRRAIIFASDKPINLPEEYELVASS